MKTQRRSRERRLGVLLVLAMGALLWVWARQALIVTSMPAATAVESSSATAVSQWQARVAQNPTSADVYAGLGLAYLQRVRETGDAALYSLAEQAFEEALAHEPQHGDALMGQGILALARHDFAAALAWGEQARAQNPYRAQNVGILVDAYVELGRYEEAVTAVQMMVDLRPDLASYSRVSYVRELHGDVPGAVEAMKMAVTSGIPGTEETAWTQVQLGNLYLNHGNVAQAEAQYRETLHYRPAYPYALAGLARVQAARGEIDAAIELIRPLLTRLPLPEFALLLAELYEAAAQPAQAQQQYELVRLMQQLNTGAGMNVDVEMALFEANHGEAAQAVALARAGYGRSPNIYAADALAWALYQTGAYAEASQYSQEALRLDTQDAWLYYHGGMIALAVGEQERGDAYLRTAVEINPGFSIKPLGSH